MYSGDSNDASPSPGSVGSTNASVWYMYSGYKAFMKNYVGLNGASSPQDKLFACPVDVINPNWVFDRNKPPPHFVRRSVHDTSLFDYSSYTFNGGDNVTRTLPKVGSVTLPGLTGAKLSSVRHPERTILLAETSALWPYSWHDPLSHGVSYLNGTFYRDSQNVVSFVDSHVSYIKMYCKYGCAAFLTNPPEGYDYQLSPD